VASARVFEERRFVAIRKESLMRVEISDGVIWRDLGGDVVILNVETGVYFGLDGSGGQIWRELVEHGSIEKTFASLKQQFDVEPDELHRDLDALMDQLVEKRLVHLNAERKGRLR
jgi:hypothetical protein